MLKKIFKLLTTTLVFFCVATVIAQMILAGVFWLKGGLTAEKREHILAAIYGLDLPAMWEGAKNELSRSDPDSSLEARVMQNEELVARTDAFGETRLDLMTLESDVQELKRLSTLRITDFDSFLDELETDALDTGLAEVRQTIEVMQTKQARVQLLRMLDDGAMNDVVKMVKSMPVTKRKKILGEFKSQDDAERLHEVLRQLREVAARNDGQNTGQPPL